MSNDLIESKIQKRDTLYYLITEEEIENIAEQKRLSRLFELFASISASVFFGILLTRLFNPNIQEDTVALMYVFMGLAFLVFIVSMMLIIYQDIKHKRLLKNIVRKEPDAFKLNTVTKQDNPQYFVGSRKIIMNISVAQEEKLFILLRTTIRYKELDTTYHRNKHKTDYFTFIIKNGNEALYNDFKAFLQNNDINVIDYKYK